MGKRSKWRVYFNSSEEWPLVWSVDEGTVATEYKYAKVTIQGEAVTRYNPNADNKTEPRAWVEVEGELVAKINMVDLAQPPEATIWGNMVVRQGGYD